MCRELLRSCQMRGAMTILISSTQHNSLCGDRNGSVLVVRCSEDRKSNEADGGL
ncbi:MAG TPA: hypothetical protein PKA28_13005 [Methylomusa anaerophila]|nr:hypothetical protein [Methylomusa anaerophila]